MDKAREDVLGIDHADAREDEIRVLVADGLSLGPEAIEAKAIFLGHLWLGIPRRACMPIRAVVILKPDGFEGWLEGDERSLAFSGDDLEVLHALIRRAEEKAGLKEGEPDASLLGFRWWPESWELERLRSCCAVLRSRDGRAMAMLRLLQDGVLSLRISDDAGREAELRMRIHLLPAARRLLEEWERIVGRVRFDEASGLTLVRVEGGEVGFDLGKAGRLIELLRDLGLGSLSPEDVQSQAKGGRDGHASAHR
jgi:hypothetical protein